MTTPELRVLIVADDPLARSGLAALAAQAPALTVAGQTASADDLVAALAAFRPDAIVWDVGWDFDASLARLGEVADALPPVVVLAPAQADADSLRAAGAVGLLLRNVDALRLAAAVAAAVNGLVVFDPVLAPVLSIQAGDPLPLFEELTPRELEVLQLVAEGMANKAIGRRLQISEHTVKFHLNSILGKLGAQSRTDAVVRATRAGLILL